MLKGLKVITNEFSFQENEIVSDIGYGDDTLFEAMESSHSSISKQDVMYIWFYNLSQEIFYIL